MATVAEESKVLSVSWGTAPASAEPRPLRWSFEQFRQMEDMGWFEDRRVELIHGEIIEMPTMNPPHWQAVVRASRVLQRLFGDSYIVAIQLPLKLSDVSAPLPDIAVIGGELEDYQEEIPRRALLCLEISDSTLQYDRTVKAGLYAASDIPEYWLLDVRQRRLEQFHAPAADAEQGALYRETHIFEESDTLSPHFAPDIQIKVADLLP